MTMPSEHHPHSAMSPPVDCDSTATSINEDAASTLDHASAPLSSSATTGKRPRTVSIPSSSTIEHQPKHVVLDPAGNARGDQVPITPSASVTDISRSVLMNNDGSMAINLTTTEMYREPQSLETIHSAEQSAAASTRTSPVDDLMLQYQQCTEVNDVAIPNTQICLQTPASDREMAASILSMLRVVSRPPSKPSSALASVVQSAEHSTPNSARHTPEPSRVASDMTSINPISDQSPLTPTAFAQLLSSHFRCMSPDSQDRALVTLLDQCCTKRQLCIVANNVLPRLKHDIIGALPYEIAVHILGFVPVHSLCRLASTSRYYRTLVQDNQVWRRLCEAHGFTEATDVTARSSIVRRPTDYRQLFRRRHTIRSNWEHGVFRHSTAEGPHNAIVTALQFDDWRAVIATDNADFGLIEVFDSVTGDRLHQLRGHEGGVWALEFVNGMLVTGGCDRDVRVWDLDTGDCVHRMPGHTSTVRCLKILDDGRTCVTGSRDHSIRVWDFISGTSMRTLRGHTGSVRCLAVHEGQVVSGSYDNSVRLWDIESGQMLMTMQGHQAQIYSVAFNGVHACSGSLDADVRIWNAATGECLFTLEGHDALVGHMQLRGSTLVTGGSDGRVCVWDVRTGDFLKRINAHANSVTTLCFDNDRIVSGGDDGVKIWDFTTGRFLRGTHQDVTGVWRLQANASKLVVAVQRDDTTMLEIMDFDTENAARATTTDMSTNDVVASAIPKVTIEPTDTTSWNLHAMEE